MEKRSENGNYEGNTKTKVFLHFQKHFTIQDALAGHSLENSVKKNSVLENKHIRKLLAKAFRKYSTSHGLRTLCNGPETQMQRKSESAPDILTAS